MPSYPEDVPFEVIRESWCSYDVGNDCTLRIKLVLAKILKPPGVSIEKSREFNFQARPSIAIYAPQDKKGPPETKQLTPKLLEESIIDYIDPKDQETSVNEYRLKNDTIIRLSLMLTRVALTSLYSADGSPVYLVNHQIVPQIIHPKPVRKRKTSTVV